MAQIHCTTGSDTILQVKKLQGTLLQYNITAAVTDKTCCLTTFAIVFYWVLHIKHGLVTILQPSLAESGAISVFGRGRAQFN